MAVHRNLISIQEAGELVSQLAEMSNRYRDQIRSQSTHIADLDLAMSNPSSAQIEVLADRIVDLTTLDNLSHMNRQRVWTAP